MPCDIQVHAPERESPCARPSNVLNCRSTEEFSYFTLCRKDTPTISATSLFGIACSRQIDASLLINRSADVTRSTVQKAVVVVTDTPQRVGQLREKLSVVTSAWFAQRYVEPCPLGGVYWTLFMRRRDMHIGGDTFMNPIVANITSLISVTFLTSIF